MSTPRLTQGERSARSREAFLLAAAQAISKVGYANVKLEQIARTAGYTRGALYHQFANKEELAREVIGWVAAEWYREVWELAVREIEPTAALVAVARAHVIFCRRDIARVMMALRVEFEGQDHPVSESLRVVIDDLVQRFADLLEAAHGGDHVGPTDVRILARAGLGAVEGLAIEVAGKTPEDADLAERVIRALLPRG